MKVLVGFIMDGKAGGIDKYLLNFLEEVSSEGVQLDFMTNEIDPELQEHLREYHAGLYAIPNLRHPIAQYRRVKRIIKKGRYDAVYLNISTAIDCIAAIAAKHAGVKKRMIHSHSSGNDCENAWRRWLFDVIHKSCRLFLYRYGTEFYGCSVEAGAWMFPEKVVHSDKFRVIHNAVDRAKYEYDPEKRRMIRAQLGIGDQRVFGHIGNFCYQKNHYFLLNVFEEIHKRDKETMLLLAGDGVRFEQVKRMIAEKNLTDSVILLGRRNDADILYQGMDAFIFPSNFEGLGIVGIEAQSAGLPCFMSDKVPTECKITKKCYFLPLGYGAAVWADEIIRNTGEREKAEYLEKAEMYDLSNQKEELIKIVKG